ncbi:hypothetical protein DFH06DRAFT_1156606 [Mycena polygramma]|nr:hypothetical protein DFH06DRAFT_1156606 [Mycena polygramma]
MAQILASLTPSSVKAGTEETDADNRVLVSVYRSVSGEAHHVLLIGRLLVVTEPADGLRVRNFPFIHPQLKMLPALGPWRSRDTTRKMLQDQHVVLDALMSDSTDVSRYVVGCQAQCQGSPETFTGLIFVRVSGGTLLDLNDFSSPPSPSLSRCTSPQRPHHHILDSNPPFSQYAMSPRATSGSLHIREMYNVERVKTVASRFA